MKINLIEVPTPQVVEFQLMADPNRELLRESKTVRVSIDHETKTRIGTSMQIGNSRTGINFPANGFKTHEKTEWNYFSGNQVTKHFFVKSKKQDIESYKEYVKAVVETALKDYLHMDLDEVTIELETRKF
jgi:hypothetical protein